MVRNRAERSAKLSKEKEDQNWHWYASWFQQPFGSGRAQTVDLKWWTQTVELKRLSSNGELGLPVQIGTVWPGKFTLPTPSKTMSGLLALLNPGDSYRVTEFELQPFLNHVLVYSAMFQCILLCFTGFECPTVSVIFYNVHYVPLYCNSIPSPTQSSWSLGIQMESKMESKWRSPATTLSTFAANTAPNSEICNTGLNSELRFAALIIQLRHFLEFFTVSS